MGTTMRKRKVRVDPSGDVAVSHAIVVFSAQLYESFLEKVPILEHLTKAREPCLCKRRFCARVLM